MAQEKELSFLELRLPKNNEYTTEPMEALLANLARNQKRSLSSLFSPQKPNFLNRKKLWQKIVACQSFRSAPVLNLAEIAALWHLPSGKINLPNILWGRTLITTN